MADDPAEDWVSQAPAAMRPVLADCLGGRISAPVALMRLLLSGQPASAVAAGLETIRRSTPDPPARLVELVSLARRQHDGLALLERMVQAGSDHRPAPSTETGIALSRAMFDRLVR